MGDTCQRCGMKFFEYAGKLYCGRRCRKASGKKRKTARKWAGKPSVKCAICGAEFQPYGLRTKTCSAGCTASHKKQLKKAKAKERGAEYKRAWYKKHGRARYASISAQRKADRDNDRQHKADLAAVPVVIAALRREIMIRDGAAKCFGCDRVLPLAQLRMGASKVCGQCRQCRNKEQKQWLKRNPDKALAQRQRAQARIKANPETYVKVRIRDRIRKAIKLHANGTHVAGGKFRYLGCTAAEAVAYIGAQFKRGMTWGNYGKAWEIDHVIPLASFDLCNEEDRRKAFHYTNLQPLNGKKNASKGDTVQAIGHQPLLLGI